jgi:hypothetical protein
LREGNFSNRRLTKNGHLSEKVRFFLDKDSPFLGAYPDGLVVDHDPVVEIKCPISARYFKTLKDAVIAKKNAII